MKPNFTIEKSPYMGDPDYRNFVIENHSNHSYQIGNKVTQLYTKDSWKGQECFITAGGPSLEGFDFSRLVGHFTIGINKAFLTYNPSINYSMDSSFYQEMTEGKFNELEKCNVFSKWLGCPSHKIFLTPLELKRYGTEVFLIKRKWKADVERENLDSGIWGGQNSTVGAINLAISLGANPIYLLGFDMKCGTKTHYHKGYQDMGADENGKPKLIPRDSIQFNKKLQEYKAELEEMSKLWVDYNIVNLGPDSSLTCFPSKTLEEVLGV